MKKLLIFVCFFIAAFISLQSVLAQRDVTAVPSNFIDSILVDGLSEPTAMALAPDGRWFVAQQGGDLRVVKDGELLETPFVSLSVDSENERGLIGVALDPDFETNQYVYVHYTTASDPKHNRVSRFTADGDVAAGAETILLDIDDLGANTNHNGGALHFGPDGKLYVGVGDAAFDPANAQDRTNLFGSILRINADGSVPSDNPFYGELSGQNRAIWAYGLRNPFTFAFQPGTELMYINDVGAGQWEEINEGQAGGNYGWPDTEGETNDPDFVSPVYAYPHRGGDITGCSIAGAAFYNPEAAQFPAEYVGDYFFGDYCDGWIKTYDVASDTVNDFADTLGFGVVDIRVDPDGSLYYLKRSDGAIHRIVYTAIGPQPPTITKHPADVTVKEGLPASFSCSASGTPPLSYQWQRNTNVINGATSSTFTLPAASLAENGNQFRCVVSNAYGSATSNPATLTVTADGSEITVAGDLVSGLVRPFFVWMPQHEPSQGETWYHIIVTAEDGTTYLDIWRSADDVCDETICFYQPIIDELPGGFLNDDYTWQLGWWTAADGFSDLLDGPAFTVEVPVGTGPQPLTSTTSKHPWVQLELAQDESAAWYHIWIGTPDFETVYFNWIPAPDSCNDALTCTLYPPAYPNSGTYIWYIQSWGAAGFNNNDPTSWQGPFDLDLTYDAPGRVEGLTITPSTQTFDWTWDESASWYNVWIGTPDPEFEQKHFDWHMARELGCESGICRLKLDEVFEAGEYNWYVQAYGPGGFSTDGDFDPPLDSWVEGGIFVVP